MPFHTRLLQQLIVNLSYHKNDFVEKQNTGIALFSFTAARAKLRQCLQTPSESNMMGKDEIPKTGECNLPFNTNSPILFLLAGIAILTVLAQSIFFLVRAWKRGIQLGMGKEKLKKTVVTAGVFTIAPAVAIVIGVITLAKDLGLPLPWLRLSVVGSLSYETIAATNAENAMGLIFGQVSSLSAAQYVTIASVMTIGIMVGIWLVPVVCRRMQNGMISMENRDKKWGDIFSASMFIGMISAFLGYIFCNFSSVFRGNTSGLIPVCVMAVSAAVMCLAGLFVKKLKWHWISDYALPISLIAGMASAIPLTEWLS